MIPKYVETVPKVEHRKVKCWIYGEPYTGKTTFAKSFPKPLFLSTDGNALREGCLGVELVDKTVKEGRLIKTNFGWSEFEEIIAELNSGEGAEYETIVVDLIEDLYQSARKKICKDNGWSHESDDSFKAYDIVRQEFLKTLKDFISIDKNIVLISHEDKQKDITKKCGDKVTAIQSAVPEKVANKIAGMVDFTARIENDHKIHFKSDSQVFGGDRLGLKNAECDNNFDAVKKLYE